MNYEEMYEAYFDSLDEGEEALSFAEFVRLYHENTGKGLQHAS